MMHSMAAKHDLGVTASNKYSEGIHNVQQADVNSNNRSAESCLLCSGLLPPPLLARDDTTTQQQLHQVSGDPVLASFLPMTATVLYLYAVASGPAGFSMQLRWNVAMLPSGLCCLTMASYADFVAVTQASNGP